MFDRAPTFHIGATDSHLPKSKQGRGGLHPPPSRQREPHTSFRGEVQRTTDSRTNLIIQREGGGGHLPRNKSLTLLRSFYVFILGLFLTCTVNALSSAMDLKGTQA
jgi:hypothetical protein